MSVIQHQSHVELDLIFQTTAFCSENPIKHFQESLTFYELEKSHGVLVSSKCKFDYVSLITQKDAAFLLGKCIWLK